MPYIPPDHRVDAEMMPRDAGELNYAICTLLIAYIMLKGLSYQTLNDCLGALRGAGEEFYRKQVVPYEEFKEGVNGGLPWVRLGEED